MIDGGSKIHEQKGQDLDNMMEKSNDEQSRRLEATRSEPVDEKYKHLLEDMSDGYVVIQDGKYVFANKRFCEIMGCELEKR